MSKAVLLQVIQFSISTQFSSIGLIDRTLSDATTPGHSEHWNNDNEGCSTFPKAPALYIYEQKVDK